MHIQVKETTPQSGGTQWPCEPEDKSYQDKDNPYTHIKLLHYLTSPNPAGGSKRK